MPEKKEQQPLETASPAYIIGFLQGTVKYVAQALENGTITNEKAAKLLNDAYEESDRQFAAYIESL